jgi:hypothetical protein
MRISPNLLISQNLSIEESLLNYKEVSFNPSTVDRTNRQNKIDMNLTTLCICRSHPFPIYRREAL